MAREVDDKKTRQALSRLKRAKAAVERAIAKSDDPEAAEAAQIELTDWEDEFMASIEERLNTFGSAFADPSLGSEGEALSTLQLAKLKEIEKKAKGKAPKEFKRGGSSFKSRGSGFKRKGPDRRSNTRDIHDDIIAPVEDARPPDPVAALKHSGLIRKGFEPQSVEADQDGPAPAEAMKTEETRPSKPRANGFRVIKGGKADE